MSFGLNEKSVFGKALSFTNVSKKVVNSCFPSPFTNSEAADRSKEVAQRAHNLLYENPSSPSPSTWSNDDIKKFMSFSQAPSTKPEDVDGENGIPSAVFNIDGAPSSTYFPNLGVAGGIVGDGSIQGQTPAVNIRPTARVIISPNDIKTFYNVVSPQESSVQLGKSSIVNDLVKGSSQYTKPTFNYPNNSLPIIDITTPNKNY